MWCGVDKHSFDLTHVVAAAAAAAAAAAWHFEHVRKSSLLPKSFVSCAHQNSSADF